MAGAPPIPTRPTEGASVPRPTGGVGLTELPYAGAWTWESPTPPAPQAAMQLRAPGMHFWPEPVTAVIETPIGYLGIFRAPPVPYNAPLGIETFAQLNGRDVPIPDPYVGQYGAPNIPRIGGAGC
jgi:hypothetical protein